MTTQTTRFRRFGLRTMFFVMTLAAVGLGLVVHEARWEEKLANTIIAEGGVVHYRWNGSYYDKPMRETPRWLKMAATWAAMAFPDWESGDAISNQSSPIFSLPTPCTIGSRQNAHPLLR